MLCGRGSGPLCPACEHDVDPPPTTAVRGVGRAVVLFAYEGTGARVVQALKFRDGRRLVAPLADRLCAALPEGWADESTLSWVPTSAARRRARGFDQAELLARAVARRLAGECRPTLRRIPGPAQTGQDRAHRERNVHFRPHARLPRRVLLIDDVCTTGATARAAVVALHSGGVDQVRFAAVARTP